MGTLGGNSVHAAAAALTWVRDVGVVARCGADFPAAALEPAARGRRRHRRHPADRRADRPELGHLRGRRHPELGLPDAARPQRRGGPAARRHPRRVAGPGPCQPVAPVVHVAAMPLAAATAIVRSVRERAASAVITLDTHEDWRPGDRRARRRPAGRCVRALTREELAELTGYDDPERAADELTAAGVRCVVVKLGGDGALVARPGHAAGARARRPAAVVDPDRRRRQLLRRVRGRARSRRRRRRGRPRAAPLRPRRPPRSARPARCGSWIAAGSPATCWPAAAAGACGGPRGHPAVSVRPPARTGGSRSTEPSPGADDAYGIEIMRPGDRDDPRRHRRPASPIPAATCGSWRTGWPGGGSSTCT